MTEPLWRPSAERIAAANITAFIERANAAHGLALKDYGDLWRWSVDDIEGFWSLLWEFGGVIAETRGDTVLTDGDRMPGAQFFPQARLNFAENLLRRRDDAPAIIFRREDGLRTEMSFAELADAVGRLANALRGAGVGPGDRVAGYLPNMPETIVAALAAASIGAIWSSCSPDFGERGVLDRFGQIAPSVLFCVDGYVYNGKSHDCLAKVRGVLEGLDTAPKTVVIPFVDDAPDLSSLPGAVTYADFTAGMDPALSFAPMPFDHPLYIMYSSGTTGAPKCIVHGAGGTLLQHIKEHVLHTDITPDDRLFYFTTCGWMMWNWQISGLAAGATLLLFDGAPFHPGWEVLFDYAGEEGMTVFGTSAKYIDALAKAGAEPVKSHDLSALKAMLSTGSPLGPESFDYVYDKVKADLCLSSISGGTDIVSCFMLGNPTGPVWRGEIQARGLGMAVDVFDDDGNSVRGEQGELVCTRPFPCMPVGFWNDPDGARYRAAYFERFANIWHHGDYVMLTEHDGVIHFGRSDATLNPGGVRIGTAEIYRQVEQIDAVLESLVIGQDWDNDTRVVLFVRLRDGVTLDDDLIKTIRTRIRQNCTPRHVPAKVVQVADIPRTKSGKITELAVRDVVHGRAVKNKEALANPEALDLYAGLAELKD